MLVSLITKGFIHKKGSSIRIISDNIRIAGFTGTRSLRQIWVYLTLTWLTLLNSLVEKSSSLPDIDIAELVGWDKFEFTRHWYCWTRWLRQFRVYQTLILLNSLAETVYQTLTFPNSLAETISRSLPDLCSFDKFVVCCRDMSQSSNSDDSNGKRYVLCYVIV